jgi:hypothetical protein
MICLSNKNNYCLQFSSVKFSFGNTGREGRKQEAKGGRTNNVISPSERFAFSGILAETVILVFFLGFPRDLAIAFLCVFPERWVRTAQKTANAH